MLQLAALLATVACTGRAIEGVARAPRAFYMAALPFVPLAWSGGRWMTLLIVPRPAPAEAGVSPTLGPSEFGVRGRNRFRRDRTGPRRSAVARRATCRGPFQTRAAGCRKS